MLIQLILALWMFFWHFWATWFQRLLAHAKRAPQGAPLARLVRPEVWSPAGNGWRDLQVRRGAQLLRQTGPAQEPQRTGRGLQPWHPRHEIQDQGEGLWLWLCWWFFLCLEIHYQESIEDMLIYIYVWLMGRGGIKQIQGFETLCCHGFSRPLLCLDEADFTE